jgi:2-polyprenyl-3-methyl-5-hydroxy-6-metoxy-1,4-benzoquinol methylase
MQKFDWAPSLPTREFVDARIAMMCGGIGWQRTIQYLHQSGIAFSSVKVAEVGCGSGTFALTLKLLGAEVTLIDYDEAALNTARQAFALYKCDADFIRGDVTQEVPATLSGRFNLATSSGLAEHFEGKERLKCVLYHRDLLEPNGFVRIGVPNRISPWYRLVTGFRKMTGTWNIHLEKPFSPKELAEIARISGFQKYEVIGNYPLIVDLKEYSKALISDMSKLLPLVRKGMKYLKPEAGDARKKAEHFDAREFVDRMKREALESSPFAIKASLKDKFSAGIILFGFK